MLLESKQKADDIANFKHRQLLYNSSLPAYINCDEMPEPPELPEWLQE